MAEQKTCVNVMHQQKDHQEKVLESFPDVFADIGNGLIFKRNVIRPEQVKDGPTESIYKAEDGMAYREQRRDVVKYVEDVGIQLAMVGMENQTARDRDMAVRVMGYDYASYRMQVDQGTRRYPVITAVLYFGDEEWDTARSLKELMHVPEEFEDQFVDYRINLIDVPRLTREERANLVSDFKVIADYFAEKNEEGYKPDAVKALVHPEAVADFFHIFTGDERFAQEKEKLAAEHREGSVIRMCDLFDKAEARGRSEGVEIANELNRKLVEAGRADDIVKAAMDPEYQKKLFAEFGLMKD